MTATVSPGDFMAAARSPLNGSSPWASRYAAELRRVIEWHGRNAPRSLQRHLGPSELGSPCDRQVAGKMAGVAPTNHVADPWPSILGTAMHVWLAEKFEAENGRRGGIRWLPERRVTPHSDHPGTADLYDAQERAVVDWKILGETSLDKVRAVSGPPIRYQVQLLLYGKGYRLAGFPVDRVVLVALPRSRASLDEMYVWEREARPDDDALLDLVFDLTAKRRAWADRILSGEITLMQIPKRASDDECYFCPFYRPQSAHDNGPGCTGTIR